MIKILVLFYIYLISIVNLAAQNKNDIIGEWLVESKDAKIEIYEEKGKYHGEISWIKEPNDNRGKPKTDRYNPKEDLRGKKLVGLKLLFNFEYESNNLWKDGTIYDPESGKTYKSIMKLSTNGKKLEVRGYLGISLIGRSQIWTKVE